MFTTLVAFFRKLSPNSTPLGSKRTLISLRCQPSNERLIALTISSSLQKASSFSSPTTIASWFVNALRKTLFAFLRAVTPALYFVLSVFHPSLVKHVIPEQHDLNARIAVVEKEVDRLFNDVGRERDFRTGAINELKTMLTTLQQHLYEQDREFRGVINRILGALIVLQILVPVALKFLFQS